MRALTTYLGSRVATDLGTASLSLLLLLLLPMAAADRLSAQGDVVVRQAQPEEIHEESGTSIPSPMLIELPAPWLGEIQEGLRGKVTQSQGYWCEDVEMSEIQLARHDRDSERPGWQISATLRSRSAFPRRAKVSLEVYREDEVAIRLDSDVVLVESGKNRDVSWDPKPVMFSEEGPPWAIRAILEVEKHVESAESALAPLRHCTGVENDIARLQCFDDAFAAQGRQPEPTGMIDVSVKTETPRVTRPRNFQDIQEADEGMVKACRFLGSVHGKSGFGGLAGGRARRGAKNSAKRKAFELGATHIIFSDFNNASGGYNMLSTIEARAYDCSSGP